jgi:hypothetical protein
LGRSGPTGDYAVKGLSPGEYLFVAESPRFVDPAPDRLQVREGSWVDRSFTLRAAASITLVVKDEVAEPAPSVVVTVVDAEGRKVQAKSDGLGGGTTDQAGKITLRKLPAGENLTLRLIRPGFEVQEASQQLREGDNGVLDVRIRRIQ